ncbi:hypothetical protein CCMA1212_003107 [Trichoderma ghanense]|uniref:Uncharacterized protein n=1 Tax=Trichoderma ghanense TaxID=65468 RepID=A0ABY2H9D2_9HYPO
MSAAGRMPPASHWGRALDEPGLGLSVSCLVVSSVGVWPGVLVACWSSAGRLLVVSRVVTLQQLVKCKT